MDSNCHGAKLSREFDTLDFGSTINLLLTHMPFIPTYARRKTIVL
jgi:hypothetical protein